MRLSFIIALVVIASYNTTAQTSPTIKYYDSVGNVTSKEKGFYYSQYAILDKGYSVTSYWVRSNNIKSTTLYTDTSMSKVQGLSKKFYESGQIEDSSFYNNDGTMINSYYYYPSGKLWVHYTNDVNGEREVTEAYDTSNMPIKNFIYFREAEYRGGNKEWQAYLGRSIKTRVPVKNGAPVGDYQTMVRFAIDIDGELISVEPLTNLGFGMEEEVLRVVKKSPKWIPAIWLNKPVKAYRRQPLTFRVSDQ